MNKVKVSVKNNVTGREYGQVLDSQELADAWIEKQTQKESWGKNQYDVVVDEMVAPNERAIYKEDRSLTENQPTEGYEPVIDEDTGDVLYYEKVKHVYTIPCEYVVTVEDYVDYSANEKFRNHILKNTDWLFISDVSINTADRNIYREYRQYLRDIPLSAAKIENFSEWLRRNYPEQFMDGGRSEELIAKFSYYL